MVSLYSNGNNLPNTLKCFCTVSFAFRHCSRLCSFAKLLKSTDFPLCPLLRLFHTLITIRLTCHSSFYPGIPQTPEWCFPMSIYWGPLCVLKFHGFHQMQNMKYLPLPYHKKNSFSALKVFLLHLFPVHHIRPHQKFPVHHIKPLTFSVTIVLHFT